MPGENENNVQARVLREIRILNTTKPGIAVLELQTAKGSEHFAVARNQLKQIAEHLARKAEAPSVTEGEASE